MDEILRSSGQYGPRVAGARRRRPADPAARRSSAAGPERRRRHYADRVPRHRPAVRRATPTSDPAGTFTEQALRSLPGAATAELHPCATVTVALDAVRAGEADHAVVPIENSVEGSVPVTLDELATRASR